MSALGLMSWNVRYFSHHVRGITSVERNLEFAALAVASLDPQPDVLALQEIDNHSIRSTLSRLGRRDLRNGATEPQIVRFVEQLNRASAARAGREYEVLFFRAHGHDAIWSLYSTGLAVIYRRGLEVVDENSTAPHEITYRRLQAFSRMKQKRICAHVRLRDERRQTFDLFNTHLSLPAFLQRTDRATGRRFGEADNQLHEIRGVLDFMRDRGDPDCSLLVGDFNAVPGSRVYNMVVGDGSPLRDAFAGHFKLSPEELVRIPSAGFMRLRFRLDHVFAGPRVRLLGFPHTYPFGVEHPMRGLSDHVPIMGSFVIRK
jgi:endonuclease/exonuclease/phosphatase family metal-dependent hydrolase